MPLPHRHRYHRIVHPQDHYGVFWIVVSFILAAVAIGLIYIGWDHNYLAQNNSYERIEIYSNEIWSYDNKWGLVQVIDEEKTIAYLSGFFQNSESIQSEGLDNDFKLKAVFVGDKVDVEIYFNELNFMSEDHRGWMSPHIYWVMRWTDHKYPD